MGFRSIKTRAMGLAIVAVALASACSADPPQTASDSEPAVEPTSEPAEPTMHVSVGVSGTFLPLAAVFVAQHNGYYEDEGLEVEIQEASGLTGAQAVVAGDLDFFASGSTDIMLLAERGEELLSVVTPEKDLILSLSLNPDIIDETAVQPDAPLADRLAALEGLTIAVSGEGSVTDTTLQLMLEQANLSPNDVNKVSIDAHPARLAALEEGQIDGFVAGAPLDTVTERSENAVIFIHATELTAVEDFVFESVFGRKAWVESHPEETRALARAITRANEFLLNDPGAIDLLHSTEFEEIDREALEESLERVKEGIPADGKMTESEWQGVMSFAIAGGLLSQEIDVSEGTVWTNEYLD